MLNSNVDLSFCIKEKIREIEFQGLKIGGNTSLSFMQENNNTAKSLIAIEIPYLFDSSYPDILKREWNTKTFKETFEKALKSNADIISIKFNRNKNLLTICKDYGIFLQ